jgi:hypothetical protein
MKLKSDEAEMSQELAFSIAVVIEDFTVCQVQWVCQVPGLIRTV